MRDDRELRAHHQGGGVAPAMKLARVLAIGGSDSGGGAGIEADIKTITVLGGYAMTAITAVTVQDTRKVWAIEPVPPAVTRLAVEVAFQDIGVDAVKTGMLADPALIRFIAEALPPEIPLVVDPVLVSTSGTALIPDEAMRALRRDLLPRASLVTPNLPEAAALTGMAVETSAGIRAAGAALRGMGAGAVLIKGGHADGDILTDTLITAEGVREFSLPRVATRHGHGTGCALASAIATGLGQGLRLAEAVERAKRFVRAALAAAPGYGAGNGPIGHLAGAGLPEGLIWHSIP